MELLAQIATIVGAIAGVASLIYAIMDDRDSD